MTGRSLGGGVTSAVDAAHVTSAVLIELGLDSGTLYIALAGHDIDNGGHTYQAALGVGTVETIEETDAGVMGVAFTLSHVNASNIALALGTEVQGRSCVIKQWFLDSAGAAQVDSNVWTGYLDQMPLQDVSAPGVIDGGIRLTAEHRLVRWDTPRPVRFSDEDQRVIASTDGFFKNSAAVAEAVLVWPNAVYFKQQ